MTKIKILIMIPNPNRNNLRAPSIKLEHPRRIKRDRKTRLRFKTVRKSRRLELMVRRIASQSKTPSQTKMTNSKKITQAINVNMRECNISIRI